MTFNGRQQHLFPTTNDQPEKQMPETGSQKSEVPILVRLDGWHT
jgi:hypothetical protein